MRLGELNVAANFQCLWRYPDQYIDLALDMHTRNAAYVMRLDDRTGSIESGKRADPMVIDRNLFEIPATKINEATVVLTMMDGEVVYLADGTG